jgi:dihydroorotate dehydrogenase electron transfer subunit
LRTSIDIIRPVVLEEIIYETPTISTLVFKDPLSSKAKPGQFLMVWIPGHEELPMSVMIVPNKRDYSAVTIKKQGFGSTALFARREGELLGLRGPYGNHFTVGKTTKKILIIGGGTGLVPLLRLISFLKKNTVYVTVIIGARSKEEVLFETYTRNLLASNQHEILISTNDGSYGFHGDATDLLSVVLKDKEFCAIYACGQELMMKKVLDLATIYSIPVQASLERYMKCGIGICGSCCLDDQLVCKDGTVFNERRLSTLRDFGTAYRDKSGRKSCF